MYEKRDWREIDFSKPGFWLVRVDSDVARELVKRNTKNRRVRPSQRHIIGRQIDSGEYQSNHPQSVLFDENGVLMDGQHRLLEIADRELYGDAAPWVRIETGVPVEMRKYLDTGISRTLDDRVVLHEDAMFNKFVCSIITASRPFAKGVHGNAKKPLPSDAIVFFEQHSKALHATYEIHRGEKATGQVMVSLAAM
jgi:hypothetical protein